MAKHKNIVGSLTNVQHARIGDDIHVHLPPPAFTKELTLYIPRTHPDDLVGREDDLILLQRSLAKEKRVVVVNGLGGIGKTTLAQAYVHRFYEKYRHIAWITQDSDDLKKDIVNTSGLIKNLHIQASFSDPRQLFEEIIRKLKSIPGRPNLLVIDNGERTLEKYRDLLPAQPHWHLLVTSRESISGFHRQTLGFLDEQEALALFRKYYPYRAIDDTGLKKLLKTIGYHTLTIEILAKMTAVQRYDLPALQKAIAKDLRANIEVAHSRRTGIIERIGSYLRTTFTLSRLAKDEIWVLKQLACMPPEPHTYGLLRQLLVDDENKIRLSELLMSLSDKGWLLHNTAADTYSMHRIIAEVVRKQASVKLDDISHLLATISGKLKSEPVIEDFGKLALVPFGRAILNAFPKSKAPAITELQNHLGYILSILGDHVAARTLLGKAAKADTKNFGRHHPTTTTRYSNLALVLRDMGKYKEAETLLQQAVRDDEMNLGPEHPHTALRYFNLGLILIDLGKDKEAKNALQRSLVLNRGNYSTHFSTISNAYSVLGVLVSGQGEPRKGKAMLEKALGICQKHFGPDHPETAGLYNNMALVLNDLGKHAKARVFFERALAIEEKVHGPQHHCIARNYNNLALTLNKLGQRQEAIMMMEKAVQIDELNFGPKHPSAALSISNLAMIYSSNGDLVRSIPLMKRAIAIFEKALGYNHPTTIASYTNLGEMLFDAERYRAARTLREQAWLGNQKTLGNGHIDTARAAVHLGWCMIFLYEPAQALYLFKKALPVLRKQLRPKDAELRDAIEIHGMLLSARREALRESKKSEKTKTRSYGTH